MADGIAKPGTVFDAILDNETDLPIAEHTTDMAGYQPGVGRLECYRSPKMGEQEKSDSCNLKQCVPVVTDDNA